MKGETWWEGGKEKVRKVRKEGRGLRKRGREGGREVKGETWWEGGEGE